MRSSRPRWQLELAAYLLDNIFDFATIGCVLYVVVRHQFEPYGAEDMADLVAWVLAVLGFLAVSNELQCQRRGGMGVVT